MLQPIACGGDDEACSAADEVAREIAGAANEDALNLSPDQICALSESEMDALPRNAEYRDACRKYAEHRRNCEG